MNNISITSVGLFIFLIFLIAGCSSSNIRENKGTRIANPASENCIEDGHEVEIRVDAEGNQYGVCILSNGSECDEWAYFRGGCG